MWELDHKVGWMSKNWWLWNVMLENTLESPFDCKEIKPINPKENHSWMSIRMTAAEAETPILWPPHVKSWLIGKDSDAGWDLGQEEKGTTEDEMAGWHHWLNGREFEWTPEVGDRQIGLACCDSWGRKESDKTEWLNWTELNKLVVFYCSLWVQTHDLIWKLPHWSVYSLLLPKPCRLYFMVLFLSFKAWWGITLTITYSTGLGASFPLISHRFLPYSAGGSPQADFLQGRYFLTLYLLQLFIGLVQYP